MSARTLLAFLESSCCSRWAAICFKYVLFRYQGCRGPGQEPSLGRKRQCWYHRTLHGGARSSLSHLLQPCSHGNEHGTVYQGLLVESATLP